MTPVAPETWKWTPHPGPQAAALERGEKELLYGGARGGGKTEFGIVAMALPAILRGESGRFLHPYYRGLVLRRHAEDLSDWVDRADQIYVRLGARKFGRPPAWRFPSGAVIRTGHLRDGDAFTKYQGHQYQRMLVEEVQLISSEALYEKLLGSCRSPFPELPPQIILTANPGGVGHAWLRARFIKVYDANGNAIPYGQPFRDPKAGHWRIYIPATVDSNPTLVENDPGYIAYLNSLPLALRKAWRHGDWDSFLGQYFPEFRPNGPMQGEAAWANHVIPAHSVQLQPWWHRTISGDWGYDHPAVFLWYCETPEGQVHVYRELYTRGVSSRELGVKVARAAAEDLIQMPEPHVVLSLDPSAWRRVDEGKMVAEQFAEGIDIALGVGTAFLMDADDKVVGGRAPQSDKPAIVVRQADSQRVAGWSEVREFLRWQPLFEKGEKDEILPKLQIWDSCPHLIDTLGIMVFSEERPEDAEKIDAINGVGGDDAADSLRYGVMSFKSQRNAPPLHTYLAERLTALSRKYGGNVDPTVAFMVAQHAEAQYHKQFAVPGAATFARLSSRRRPQLRG